MKLRQARLSSFLNALILMGVVACGGGGGSDSDDPLDLQSLAIANCPTQALYPGDKVALAVEGNPAAGKAVAVNPDAFQSDRPRLAAVEAQGNLVALYPGEARVTATAGGLTSEACVVQILPPENQGTVRRLTDNADEDHWGMNNSWPMISRGKVLWQRIDGNLDTEVLLHDRRDPAGDDTSVDLVDFLSGDVDFMALGSAAAEGEVLLSYRVGLQDTHVSANGRAPQDLGDRQQEEGSIADGCYFFREGGGANDIQRFTASGLTEILSAGETYTPIGSDCEAVYERRGVTDSELVHFDGQTHLPIAAGLPAFPDFDFRRQRAVYASGGDVTLVDLTQDPPAVVPLTSDGLTRLDRNPRTDGESVVWHQIDGAEHHVWMYDIASGTRRKLSATIAPKKFDSLQIDLKQVLWVEGTELWFYAGSGDAADSAAVDLKGIPLDSAYRPYLKDGLVAYVGNDGDTEILIVE